MSNNKNIDIEINKKNGIILSLIIGASAFIGHLNLDFKVNAYAASNVEITDTTPIGTVVLRMDDVNPSTIYGGTWELITGDATLKFGDGSVLSGNVEGTNIKNVPLPEHSHGMVHSHQKGSMNITGQISAPGYQNTSVGYSLSGTGAFSNYGSITSLDDIDHGANQGSIYRAVYLNAKNSWTGSTSVPYANGTTTAKEDTDLTGVSDATIDVQGATISINAWKKVS